MPRRAVAFVAGEYYHLYDRGVHRNQVFHDRGEYLLFLTKWRQHISPGQITVIAYCLMPNHYHLLVKAGDNALAKHMHRFGLALVKAWNRIRGQSGVAFEGNFCAVHVDREEYLLHLTRYIHRNPLEAQLVVHPEEWEYSSYPEYLGIRQGSLPQMDSVLSQFSDRTHYRTFVEQQSDPGKIQHLMFDD
jgi:putative transposase